MVVKIGSCSVSIVEPSILNRVVGAYSSPPAMLPGASCRAASRTCNSSL
jgi:hypothetical protein